MEPCLDAVPPTRRDLFTPNECEQTDLLVDRWKGLAFGKDPGICPLIGEHSRLASSGTAGKQLEGASLVQDVERAGQDGIIFKTFNVPPQCGDLGRNG